ncbi:TrmH family RNA methyltransferase [Antarcticibacterium sp. 1MA-6-2]|uniref:TrmH family RNA methyltransferase n=1 Tax=Antarcticibacterium sp. 1MA-6-2 TaxID=2908210 RepID=UPI001F3186EB|nr:TrmH family RNA methyltransferase [Antarcticibacterium sp. 1MA-6-2]UJH91633.1 TrmH family RNA methyltransferase [Antarcticibacterium sp. 1MA-6-2]
MQLSHNEHISQLKKFPLIVLSDNLIGDANLGSLFRLADAFNIEKVVFCGTPVDISSNRLKKTARTTFQTVFYEQWESTEEALKSYLLRGYYPMALEITEDSVPINSLSFEDKDKVLLVVGNERYGISSEVLDLINKKIYIKMFGHNSSMNVAQATGIALYEITKTLPPFHEK